MISLILDLALHYAKKEAIIFQLELLAKASLSWKSAFSSLVVKLYTGTPWIWNKVLINTSLYSPHICDIQAAGQEAV